MNERAWVLHTGFNLFSLKSSALSSSLPSAVYLIYKYLFPKKH